MVALVGLIGLCLSAIGSLFLGIRGTNILSSWISRNLIGPYIRNRFIGPAEQGRKKLENNGILYSHDEGFEQVVDLLRRASPMRDTEPIEENETVEKIEVVKDRDRRGGINFSVVTTKEDERKYVDGFHRLRDRERQIRRRKVSKLGDYTRAIPGLIMAIGFILQIGSYTIRYGLI